MMKNKKRAQSGNRKQITFDLSQKELEHHYPRPKGSRNPKFYKKAYADIMAFMKENGFEHRQFSVYTSIRKMTNTDVVLLMDELAKKMPWISPCVNQIDVTNIGTQHSLLEILVSATQQQFDENVVEPPIKNDIYKKMAETSKTEAAISEAEKEYSADGVLLDAGESLSSLRRKHFG